MVFRGFVLSSSPKTWLRSTMHHEKHLSLAVMSTEREESIKLECDDALEELLKDFSKMENRR